MTTGGPCGPGEVGPWTMITSGSGSASSPPQMPGLPAKAPEPGSVAVTVTSSPAWMIPQAYMLKPE